MNTYLCGAVKRAIHKKKCRISNARVWKVLHCTHVIDRENYCLAIKINLALRALYRKFFITTPAYFPTPPKKKIDGENNCWVWKITGKIWYVNVDNNVWKWKCLHDMRCKFSENIYKDVKLLYFNIFKIYCFSSCVIWQAHIY